MLHKRILIFGSPTQNSNRDIFIKKYQKDSQKSSQYELLTIEITIENLKFNKFDNLFELEKYISLCVDIIVVFLESPGSIAELSTFLHDEDINKKMIIVIKKSYFEEKSFITEAIFQHFYNQCKKNQKCSCGNDKICENVVIIENDFQGNYEHNKDKRQISYKDILDVINNKLSKQVDDISYSKKIIDYISNAYDRKYTDIKDKVKIEDRELENYLNALLLLKVIKLTVKGQNKFYYIENNNISIFKYNNPLTHLIQPNIDIKSKVKISCTREKKKFYEPNDKLKAILSSVKQYLEESFKPHECAFGYVKGKTIFDNVTVHKNSSYLLTLDIQDFFPSIKLKNFIDIASKYLDIDTDNETLKDVCKVCFIDDILPIGFSTSPIISNLFMYYLDEELFIYCKKHNITYSRYADDMTFSCNTKGLLSTEKEKLINIIKNYYGLKINGTKIHYLSKANTRKVTGLIIDNNENKVSVGRKRKKQAKFYLKLLYSSEQKDKSKFFDSMRGYLSWVKSVDIEYWDRLAKNDIYRPLINSFYKDVRVLGTKNKTT